MTLSAADAIEWADLYKRWDVAAHERYQAAFVLGNTTNSLTSEIYADEKAAQNRGPRWHERAQTAYESGIALATELPFQSARYSRAVGRENVIFEEVEMKEAALAEGLRKPGTNTKVGTQLDATYRYFPEFARRAFARVVILAAINKHLSEDDKRSTLVEKEAQEKSGAARWVARFRWYDKLKAQVHADLHIASYVTVLARDGDREIAKGFHLPNAEHFPAIDDESLIAVGEITSPYEHPWIKAALEARPPRTHFPTVVMQPIAAGTIDTQAL